MMATPDPGCEAELIEECWAQEDCIRLRVEGSPGGRRVVSIVDTSDGWPGKVVATATLASFRRDRVAKAIAPDVTSSVISGVGRPYA